jgi:spore coat protein U-like protein
MRHGSLRLGYNLYLDALRSSIWGNGTSGTDHLSTTVPANGSVNVTIYGRISAKQDARIGAYSDTITVTATF